MSDSIRGKAALETLAKRFPQLYVAPAENAQAAHTLASSRGIAPEGANLNHFVTSEEDELRSVKTPAGPVEVMFLKRRGDFDTFLQIIGHKSRLDPISPTIGATTYRGLADWGAVANAHASYVENGGDNWGEEFARLAKAPGAFRAELIVISEGPYSNIPASNTPYDKAEWLLVSHEIRLHHECAHVVCRRTMPDDVLPLWDEITADVVGLLCATEHYDASLAARFLGVTKDGFTSGRLVEYVNDEQAARIDEIASEIRAALDVIAAQATSHDSSTAFDFLLDLKKSPIIEC